MIAGNLRRSQWLDRSWKVRGKNRRTDFQQSPHGAAIRRRSDHQFLNPRAYQPAAGSVLGASADGSLIDVAVFLRQLIYESRPAALIAAIDITERKRAEARVAFMAHHDALTALPNRILLRLHMEEMLGQLRRSGRGFAVLCVDLDNFKWVNDTLGHPFGDMLLQNVASRLRAELREQDTIARLGGDEFAILQADVEGPGEVSRLLTRLLAVIGEPFMLRATRYRSAPASGFCSRPMTARIPTVC
jgi:diguanylate cyclase (GGDEF)-like protein